MSQAYAARLASGSIPETATPTVSEPVSKRRLVGVFANVELGYDNFLFLTLTARNDKSSTLPEGNNSFFYPGATLSYIFSEHLPESVRRIVNFGKLRLAYGKTGNDADPYMVKPYYLQASAYNEFGNLTLPMNSINGYTLGNILGNVNLQPEISTEYEIGANISFLNSRIILDASYYNRMSDGQIFELSIDPATGYTSQNTNLGKLSNKGVELLVSVVPVRTKEFSWTLSMNYSKNNGKVERQHRTDQERFYNKLRMYNLADGRRQLAIYQKLSNKLIKTCLGLRSPNEVVIDYLAIMF